MPIYRSAQLMNADDIEDFGDEDEVVLYEEMPSKEDVIEMHQPDEESLEIVLKLPALPGSDAEPIEVSTDDAVEVMNEGKSSKNDAKDHEVLDPWDWQSRGLDRVLEWVGERFSNVPRHSGRETAGIERTIAYLKRLNNEMSKAAANDYDGKIDITRFEAARREIYSAIERLEDAKGKLEETFYKKKKADSNQEFVKEGQKTTHVGGIIITVPLHISAIARACINSMVSAGKDIEKVADHFIKKFNLTERDQMELFQLLADMNYTVRRPRGLGLNEDFDPTSPDNVDYAQNFPS